MLRFHVVTLFPELVTGFAGAGILARAAEAGHVTVGCVNPRDFATDRHRSVDDTPYGGGGGMVLAPGPYVAAIESIAPAHAGRLRRVLLTPQGRPFTQPMAHALAAESDVVLVCGRYEGFDERIRHFVDDEVSLGDFVLLGGEVAALAVIEATARLLPGVLGNEASPVEESHAQGLLEYPQYTRPLDFRGLLVPEVLRSGDHGAVARWRRREALRRTLERRPDLLARAPLTAEDRRTLEAIARETPAGTSPGPTAAAVDETEGEGGAGRGGAGDGTGP